MKLWLLTETRTPHITFLGDSAAGEVIRASKLLYVDAIKAREKLFRALELWDGEEIRKEDRLEEALISLLLQLDGHSYILCCLKKICIAGIDEVMSVFHLHSIMSLP